MRMVEYEELPALGPGTLKRSGSLRNLVFAIPYFLTSELIPPLEVINAVLRTGIADAGMSGGCKWQPFVITPDEYEELVQSLAAEGWNAVEAPKWVKTRDDWTIWVMHLRDGVPVEEHRRLTEEYAQLERGHKEARASGNPELAEELFVQSVQAGNRLSDFIMAHIKKRKDQP